MVTVQRPIRSEPPGDDDVEVADRRARAALDAGRGVAHADVRRWVEALGTPTAFPMPDEWRG